jgi:hypothetical protein
VGSWLQVVECWPEVENLAPGGVVGGDAGESLSRRDGDWCSTNSLNSCAAHTYVSWTTSPGLPSWTPVVSCALGMET